MWLVNSSIGRKVTMSVTGLFLILFLTFHSLMNVTIIIGDGGHAYNAVCEFLGANWYAIIGTLIIAAGFVLHIIFAMMLTIQNYRARGNARYAMSKTKGNVTWASKNMFVLGTIVLGFLALHMYHFWYKMQYAELFHVEGMVERAADGAYHVNNLFSNPIYSAIYIVWIVALWFHLTHGFWSGMQTLGLSNKTWLPRLRTISNIYATFIAILFLLIPVFYLFGYDIYEVRWFIH